jgi:hypothetical protein
MIDWKILAASFAALVLISSVLVGNVGGGNVFTDLFSKISEWFGSTPFSGFLVAPGPDAEKVNIKIYPERITLVPESKVNLTLNDVEVRDFSGEISIDLGENEAFVKESGSSLTMALEIDEILIEGVVNKRLVIENTKLEVSSGTWNIKTNNGSMEFYDFSGDVLVSPSVIELNGNVTKIERLD